MARNQPVNMGTSAYDLDRWAALPEIPESYPERGPERERPQPREATRTRKRTRAKAKRRARQGVSKFAVLGCLTVGILLLFVVSFHMQLTMLSAEMVQLERQMVSLQEEAAHLAFAHENAFHPVEIERFAREELGMVDAAPGQIINIGSTVSGDVAEVLWAEEAVSTNFFQRVSSRFESLREYLAFW